MQNTPSLETIVPANDRRVVEWCNKGFDLVTSAMKAIIEAKTLADAQEIAFSVGIAVAMAGDKVDAYLAGADATIIEAN